LEAYCVTSFPTYRFAASGAPTLRTLPDRLGKDLVINVKDWGATGDGSTDDTATIQAAIDYAWTTLKGAIVYIPAGTYRIADLGTPLRLSAPPSGAGGSIKIVGAGRDVTILRGNYWTAGYPVGNSYPPDPIDLPPPPYLVNILYKAGIPYGIFGVPQEVRDLTIWNENTAVYSGALNMTGSDQRMMVDNCRLIGTVGLHMAEATFGATVANSIMICSAAIGGGDPNNITLGTADSASRGPLAGSTGLAFVQGQILNCQVIGFDVGFSFAGTTGSGNVINARGCKAYRCNKGFFMGGGSLGGHSYPGGPVVYGNIDAGCHVFASMIDRCNTGIYYGNAGATMIAGSAVTSIEQTGVADPAPIANMTWNAGTHVVTVTTPSAHNIGADGAIMLNSISPAAFIPTGAGLPDDSGNGMVTISNRTAASFQYAGPSSDPGAFSSGNWNYPLTNGFSSQSYSATVIGNDFSATVSNKSIDLAPGGAKFVALRAPYGWSQPSNYPASPQYVSATGPGLPSAFLLHNRLPDMWKPDPYSGAGGSYLMEGDEFTIIDANTASFGDTVAITLWTSSVTPAGNPNVFFASVPADITNTWYVGNPFFLNEQQVAAVFADHIVLRSALGRDLPANIPLMFVPAIGASNHYKIRWNAGLQRWTRSG
jgi:hypothetical protein